MEKLPHHTYVECEECESSYNIAGKDGTNIRYIKYCPHCGAGVEYLNRTYIQE